MKKAIGIIAVVVFFLILLALLIAKLVIPSHTNTASQPRPDPFATVPLPTVSIQNDTPENTIQTCYEWYIEIYSHDAVTIDDILKRPELSSCFTQSFLSTWDERRTSVEADPVLMSQDFQESWRTTPLAIRITGQSIRSEDVEVTLGNGLQQKQVIAHVVRDGEVWKIDEVTSAH